MAAFLKVVTMTGDGQRPDHGTDRYCGGPKRQGEGTCTRPAGWGTPHSGTGRCKLHGGCTPTHVTAGQRALAERAVRTFGLPREIDPRDALLEEVYRSAGAVDWLGQQVQALLPDDVVWGKTEQVEKSATEFPGLDVTHAAVINVWVQLWRAERQHLLAAAKAAVAAGIEERKVRLAESQGALLASVIRAVLDDLGLSPEQQAKVAEVVPRHLRAVA